MAKAKKTVKKKAKKASKPKPAAKLAATKARKKTAKLAATKARKKTAKPAKKKPAKKLAATKARNAVAKKPAAKPAKKKTVATKIVAKSVATKPAKVKLSVKEKRDYKAMLLGMRQQLSRQVSALTKQSLQRNDSVVSSEDGTDAFERQFALKIASSEQNSLFDIDDALRRLEKGVYGICEDCLGTVEIPRLKALPFVRLCIKCQSEIEKGRARFRP